MKIFIETYRIFFLVLLYIGLSCLALSIEAQDSLSHSEKTLAPNELEDLSELAKYDKTVKKLMPKNKSDEKDDVQDDEPLDTGFSIGLGVFGRIFIYLLIIALIAFILYTIFSSVKVEQKIKPKEITTEEEIEDIVVIDAESGLEKAIQAKNFRLAVRMLFIKLLQVLVAEKNIEWKPEKTNRDYLFEMKNHQKIRHFENLVMAYESIWYGSESIDRLFFDYLKAEFEKFYSIENTIPDVKE